MSQVSYGTITITDMNDIEEIYTIYAGSNTEASPTFTYAAVTGGTIWKRNASALSGLKYIWQSTVVTKSGVTVDSTNWQQFYSQPVRLTGLEGDDARNITDITPYYYLSTSDSSQTGGSWSTTPQPYPSTGTAYYWTKTITTYDSGSPTESTAVLDMFLTNAAKDARDANTNAAIANSIAQQTIEDSQGAMSQAASAVKEVKRIWFAKATSDPPEDPPETGVTTGSASTHDSWSTVKPAENSSYPYYFYCDQTCTNGGVYSHSEILLEADPYTVNALNVRTKNFFHGKDSTYDGWFASGRSTNEGLNESDATTYYYNARVGATNITLGYNKTPVIDLDGRSGAINIYRLPTINSTTGLVTTAGSLGAKLNASALTFYNTSGTATSTFSDSIALASNGASITIGSTDTGKYNTYIDAQGLYLQTGTTPYATLNSNGLVLSKGGIKVIPSGGAIGDNNSVYISSDNLGSKVASLVNDNNKTNWRAIIGSKFGVDSEGNLYANEAHISGEITASKLTINSNTNISDTNGLIRNDAVEVGGRNLLYNSGTMPAVSSGDKGWRASGGTVSHIDISTPPIAGVSGGIRCTNTGSSAARIGIAQDLLANRFIVGKKYSMGCWIRASAEFSSDVAIQPIWISNSQTTNSKHISMTLNTNWQYISAEGLTLAGDQASSYSAGYVYASNVPASGYIEVCGIMLEEGTKCTSWTPAPEDVASDIEDASKVAKNYLKFTDASGLDIGYTGDANAHGRTNIQGDGMRIYDKDDNVNPVARFTKTEAQIGRDGGNRLSLTSIGESLVSDKNVKWFEIKKSGRTVSDTFEYWEPSCRDATTFTLTKTPVAQCNIDIQIDLNLNTQIRYDGSIESTATAHHTFIQGTTSSVQLNPVSGGTPSDAASNSYCTATYDSTNNSITISGLGSNVTSAGFYTIIYMAQSEAVDLGDFIFGIRNYDSYYTSENATGTVSMGKNLVVTDPYQVVIGKYNEGYDSRDKLFVIGNGVENHPNNVFSVDKDGTIRASGGFFSPVFSAIVNGYASYADVDGDLFIDGDIVAGSMAGMIQMFAGAVTQTVTNGIAKATGAPTGWLLCDGQAVNRSTYSELFNVIGTTYGAGDGKKTFNLPDLRGRFPLGVGNGTAANHTNHTLNQKGGNENAIVVSHNHYTSQGDGKEWFVTSEKDGAVNILVNATSGASHKVDSSTASLPYHHRGTTGFTGSTGAGANMPPYVGLNFIIATGKPLKN